jgi:hypothetical protein
VKLAQVEASAAAVEHDVPLAAVPTCVLVE